MLPAASFRSWSCAQSNCTLFPHFLAFLDYSQALVRSFYSNETSQKVPTSSWSNQPFHTLTSSQRHLRSRQTIQLHVTKLVASSPWCMRARLQVFLIFVPWLSRAWKAWFVQASIKKMSRSFFGAPLIVWGSGASLIISYFTPDFLGWLEV
jgi:hypothetical protein